MIYRISKLNEEGTLLLPGNTFYSEEAAQSLCTLYLEDELVKDENGGIKKFYRLHAREAHNQEMALAYDIKCPCCGEQMKQVGRTLDSHNLGLYECKHCNEN